jgi:hypothetical protein
VLIFGKTTLFKTIYKKSFVETATYGKLSEGLENTEEKSGSP